jgi:hypothetical protein
MRQASASQPASQPAVIHRLAATNAVCQGSVLGLFVGALDGLRRCHWGRGGLTLR